MWFWVGESIKNLVAKIPALLHFLNINQQRQKTVFVNIINFLSVESWHYIFSFLCLYCQRTFLSRTVLSTKCPVGKLSYWRTVLSANCPVRRTILLANCPIGELSVGEVSVVELSVGEVYVYRIQSIEFLFWSDIMFSTILFWKL